MEREGSRRRLGEEERVENGETRRVPTCTAIPLPHSTCRDSLLKLKGCELRFNWDFTRASISVLGIQLGKRTSAVLRSGLTSAAPPASTCNTIQWGF
jgi:hypothetical protein